MYFFNYIFMCLYISVYLYYQWTGAPMPEFLPQINVWVSWGFLLYSGYLSAKIIVDCLLLNAKNQMSADNMLNGILLAVLNFIPVLLMSVFMLKEGFAGK